MKKILFFALLVLLSAAPLFAVVPQPSVVYYGRVRDPYGWPYQARNRAVVCIRVNGVERDTCPVDGFLAPNVNYRFILTVGDSSPTGIYTNIPTVKVGDNVSFTIWDGSTDYPVLEAPTIPPIPQSGLLVALDLTAGHDTDHDGLPDEWEQDLIDHSNGTLYDISQVRPNDDFDGDGFSNRDEFLSGTIPDWNWDFLCIESDAKLVGGYLALNVLSVPGISYNVIGSTNLVSSTWKSIPYKLDPGAAPQTGLFIGDGYGMTIYVPATNRMGAIGLEAR